MMHLGGDFDEKYQAHCDQEYWTKGQSCFGCDFWDSDCGNTGHCRAAQIVSGDQVLLSMGVEWASIEVAPNHPVTKGEYWCGKFRDNFDWASLPTHYLRSIGAMDGNALNQPPTHARAQ